VTIQRFPKTGPIHQIQVDRKTRKARRPAFAFLDFILERKNNLWHDFFTSLVMVSFARKHHITLTYQGQRGFSLF